MKTEIVVVGDPDTVYGFRLAGVDNTFVLIEGDEAPPALVGMRDKLILASDAALKVLGDEADTLRNNNTVQEIPGKGYQGLNKIIKDTVGFDISMK